MHTASGSTGLHISDISLQLAATLLGLGGTALVIMQALFWIPSGRINPAMLIFMACVPLISAVFFALIPRRMQLPYTQDYPLRSPMTLITLGLPMLLAPLAMVLIGASGNFNNFFGFALLLAANAGRNLRDFVCSLLLHKSELRP